MPALSLKDCCRILGVREDASLAEIKRSFRKKAKRIHPDVKNAKNAASSAEMLELLEAYKALSNPSRRFSPKASSKPAGFDYRLWLLSQKDPKNRAKLIFFDLLHSFDEEAVSVYLELKKQSGFLLSSWLDREDFMDCAFILSEELILRNELYEAFALLESIAVHEYQKPYFRHFFPEAIELLVRVLSKIEDEASRAAFPDSIALKCFERALDLRLSDKENALILLRMAECCKRLGDERGAEACLKEAEKLIPQKKGTSVIPIKKNF